MFASDDITYDETLETTNTEQKSKLSDQYWNHPLHGDKIKFVDTCKELRDCIKIVFKVNLITLAKNYFDIFLAPRHGVAIVGDMVVSPPFFTKTFGTSLACRQTLLLQSWFVSKSRTFSNLSVNPT